jgi:lipopolysaccharide export system protein LptA
MTMRRRVSPAALLPPACLAALLLASAAQAEKADRSKPLVVESDGKKAASVDLAKRTTTVTGNVVITQGTLQIKADKVDVREDAPGRFSAVALGQPATFRQKRDRVDEVIEAQAQRIEYDGGADRIRLIGEARMRVLRAGQPADEATAAVIVYDQPGDTLTFEGGAPVNGAAAGRPRLVFVPRADAAASAPTRAASEVSR